MLPGKELVNSGQQTAEKGQSNATSGRIGERLVIRTTTLTGQRLRFTLSRPFRSAEPRPCRPPSQRRREKSSSDSAFDIPRKKGTAAVSGGPVLRCSSVDSHNGFFGEVCGVDGASSQKQEKSSAGSEINVKYCYNLPSSSAAKTSSTANARRRSFARNFREQRIVDRGFRKISLPSLPIPSSEAHASLATSPVSREVDAFLATNCLNCSDKSSLSDLKKSRRPVKKRTVFFEQPQSQATVANEEIRFRRREGPEEEQKSGMSSRCLSTPQSLNRSIPCVYESSQFTAMRSTSFIDGLPEAPPLPSRTRTAVVGPNTVHRSREGTSYDYGPIDKRGGIRSYCSSDITRTYTSPPTPVARYDCGDPPPYYSHRRSTQPEDGVLYPLSSTPLSRSPRCEFPQGGSPIDGSMLPRTTRPRDLRIAPAPPLVVRTADDATTSSKKHGSSSTSAGTGRVHSMQGAVGGTSMGDGGVPMNTSTNSKKMMVAPQPQSSHHRERNDSNCKGSNPQRRQSMGAIVPAYSIPVHDGSWRSRDRESPSNDQQLCVDDRRTKNNDVRVAVLEQRVRELEAAIISGQVPSTSIPATSFIIPVINTKSPSRILRSASGQFVVSAATTPTTQQLMAQEVVDKEIEVERLQSQLRKCYSRMELRQVQYDEEVNAFRRESEEAKAQLAKVKARLGDLEKECVAYREKAMAVDANRNSAVASSLEKISTQEREIATLRSDLEKNVQLVKDLDRMKKEYEFLELQNEALIATLDSKEATIRDLEDNILALKMDASSKLESGSTTPKADAFSLFDVEPSKFFNDSKALSVSEAKDGQLSPTSEAGPSKGITRFSSSSESGKLQLSPSTSKLIRKQLNTTLECRLLAKCLKDVAAKAISGDAPSVNRLLGCRSDSMSESEPEPVVAGSSAMSLNCAERHIRKVAEDLERVEKDLNTLRESFVEYYQKKIADDLKEDEACRIQ